MSNRPAPLRQSDLTRYAKAMRAAGIQAWRVEVQPNGTHSIIAGLTNSATPDTDGPDPDELLK